LADMVPERVLKEIDQSELLDRIIHSKDLMRKAQWAEDPTLAAAYRMLAGATMRALPRAQTQREIDGKLRKAEILGAGSVQGAQLRKAAQQLAEQNPQAPARVSPQLLKAAGDGELQPVYDAAGNLVGLVKPSAVTPIADAAAAMEKDTASGDSDAAAGLRRYLGTQPAAEKDEEDEASVDSAAAAARPLGTPKGPASAATPAAAGMPDEFTKARRPYNVVIRRGPQ